MLEWSLSGHCSVCINHSAQNCKGWLRKTLNRRHSILINTCRTNSIQVLNLHGFLCRFWLCPSIYILKMNEKLLFVLGAPCRDISGNQANTNKTQCKLRLAHNTGRPHQTAADHIVPKFFLDPHLTKCRWGTPILGISTLWNFNGATVEV